MFKIGDRVVCISGDPVIDKGMVGTIKEVDHRPFVKWDTYTNPERRDGFYAYYDEALKLVEAKEAIMIIEYKIDLSWIEGTARNVLSKAVQEKAFELGYNWCGTGRVCNFTERPYLYLNKDDSYVTYGDNQDFFETEVPEFKEVSVNNWLEGNLPVTKPAYAPKNSDAVLTRDTAKGIWIAGVFKSMNGKQYRTYNNCSWNDCIPFDADLEGTTRDSK